MVVGASPLLNCQFFVFKTCNGLIANLRDEHMNVFTLCTDEVLPVLQTAQASSTLQAYKHLATNGDDKFHVEILL